MMLLFQELLYHPPQDEGQYDDEEQSRERMTEQEAPFGVLRHTVQVEVSWSSLPNGLREHEAVELRVVTWVEFVARTSGLGRQGATSPALVDGVVPVVERPHRTDVLPELIATHPPS